MGIAGALEQISNFLGLGMLLGYALVTSIMMIWLSRACWSPFVLHGTIVTVVCVHGYQRDQQREQEEAEYRSSPAYLERERKHLLPGCLRARVSIDPREQSVKLVVQNFECPFSVTIWDDANLVALWPDGNEIFSGPARKSELRVIDQGQQHILPLRGTVDSTLLSRSLWWRANLSVERPYDTLVCFATEGTPKAHACDSMPSPALR
ncbi:MAG: hypothetical protein JKY37_02440 [Nannocystaceae bacterium]|nr:hypothetical protein [Nannocystaceae bacterium]